MDDIYKNIEECNPKKQQKILFIFDEMTADTLSNKKLNPIDCKVTELFSRGKKLNIYCVFITQYYFAVPKNIRLTSTHSFVMEILDKRELQQVAFNHLQILNFKTLCILMKSVLQNHVFYWLLILLLHQLILQLSERT